MTLLFVEAIAVEEQTFILRDDLDEVRMLDRVSADMTEAHDNSPWNVLALSIIPRGAGFLIPSFAGVLVCGIIHAGSWDGVRHKRFVYYTVGHRARASPHLSGYHAVVQGGQLLQYTPVTGDGNAENTAINSGIFNSWELSPPTLALRIRSVYNRGMRLVPSLKKC